MKGQAVSKSDVSRLTAIIKDYLKIDVAVKTRKRNYIDARMVFYTILRELGNQWVAIADIHKKDHSTIINSVNTFYDLSQLEPELKAKYTLIRDVFYSERGEHPIELETRSDLIKLALKLERENDKLQREAHAMKKKMILQDKYMTIVKQLDAYEIDGFEIDLINSRLSSILTTMHEKYRNQKV